MIGNMPTRVFFHQRDQHGGITKSRVREFEGGGVSLVMQPLRAHHMAHEAEEYPAMNESTTDIRIVPLPTGQDVLTEVLREGARRMLARAIEAEVAAWI